MNVTDSSCNVNLDDAMMLILLILFLIFFWTELPKKMKIKFYKYHVLFLKIIQMKLKIRKNSCNITKWHVKKWKMKFNFLKFESPWSPSHCHLEQAMMFLCPKPWSAKTMGEALTPKSVSITEQSFQRGLQEPRLSDSFRTWMWV